MKKKIEIIDIDTVGKLFGCTRSNIYTHYLKKGLLTPVPRTSKKAYFLKDEVYNILNEKLYEINARKNIQLIEVTMDSNSITKAFVKKYVELTIK